MSERDDLLIEIGTEELPPKALKTLSQAFEQGILDGLDKAQLAYGKSQRYATPRRLAVLVRDVTTQQPEQRQERRGPAIQAAYDKDGKPTKAAEGFAVSCGVAVADLQTLETDKGAWLAFTRVEPGKSAELVLPEILEKALSDLPVPKRMRWGSRDDEFVRPVHWIVLLHGGRVVPATLFGIASGSTTRGHRFHHPELIEIKDISSYAASLQTDGKVIVDFDQRREKIREQTQALTKQAGGQAVIDDDLLDEVTALVEWPMAILANFESRFLQIPPEVLMTTMKGNQKYFPIVDNAGKLLPHFITISNLESQDPSQIRIGNERVIRPRLSDAEFFWNQDRKQTLNAGREALHHVVFQQKLGSVHLKSVRVAGLARFIADQSNSANPDWAERAATLSKCDLLTNMVQEFPELQGVMGRYYAQHDNEAEEVAQALEEQYRPRFAGDELPQTDTGRTLALADRIDTLLGIFAIGQAPSGAKDPFALRRAALGVLRIMIECKWDLDLDAVLQEAARHYAGSEVDAQKVVPDVFDFLIERLRAYYLEQGFQADEFEAVQAVRPRKPLDFDRRIRAVSAFRQQAAAASLAAANKRIRNILKKSAPPSQQLELQRQQLIEPAEQDLAKHLDSLTADAVKLMEAGQYSDALLQLAALREPVDRFFDDVMVMVDDENLRNNRIALLNQLSDLFLRTADFSRLQG